MLRATTNISGMVQAVVSWRKACGVTAGRGRSVPSGQGRGRGLVGRRAAGSLLPLYLPHWSPSELTRSFSSSSSSSSSNTTSSSIQGSGKPGPDDLHEGGDAELEVVVGLGTVPFEEGAEALAVRREDLVPGALQSVRARAARVPLRVSLLRLLKGSRAQEVIAKGPHGGQCVKKGRMRWKEGGTHAPQRSPP